MYCPGLFMSYIDYFFQHRGSLYQKNSISPYQEKIVYDFASIFSESERNALESSLIAFDDSTSNQITVVLVKSLMGYEISDLAYRIGQEWGVGDKNYNNGIVILIKPKSNVEKGEVFIAVGYGLESVLPDARCKWIIDKVMLPYFIHEKYYEGIICALSFLKSFSRQSFSKERPEKASNDSPNEHKMGNFSLYSVLILFLLLLLYLCFKLKKKKLFSFDNRSINIFPVVDHWRINNTKEDSGNSAEKKELEFKPVNQSHNKSNIANSNELSTKETDSENKTRIFKGFGRGRFGGGGSGGSW